MDTIPIEIFHHIFQFVSNDDGHTWYNVMLVSSKFLNVGRKVFDASLNNNRAIRQAAASGKTESVRTLLQHPKVNPAAAGNYAVQVAAWNGHLEAVKLLLGDIRVNPADLENYAIYPTCENGHESVARELLKDPRVDPSVCRNHAIRYASANGHLAVVQLLMKDKRANPADLDNFALRVAAANGHWQVVQELLKDPRVDPSQNNNEAVKRASERGEVEVVFVLLRDSRVDPAAVDYGFLRVIDLLGYWQLANFCIECKQNGISRPWSPLMSSTQYSTTLDSARWGELMIGYPTQPYYLPNLTLKVPTVVAADSKTVKSRRLSLEA